MMMLIGLLVFGAAAAATISVMMGTLAPAMPRIVALLSGDTEHDRYAFATNPAMRESARPVIRRPQAVVAAVRVAA